MVNKFDWSIFFLTLFKAKNFFMSQEKIEEIEHEDFSNTAASGASLTYPMQVKTTNSVQPCEREVMFVSSRVHAKLST